ncbi:hypothetical protein Pelo_14161 [Pelomyxa schiedti]|nr:hypothetical protein Pelo_14161 [Pelomyxa schiedti]
MLCYIMKGYEFLAEAHVDVVEWRRQLLLLWLAESITITSGLMQMCAKITTAAGNSLITHSLMTWWIVANGLRTLYVT